MLEHSRGLSIGPDESLTVAARGIEDRPRLAAADGDGRTHVLSLRGADLTAFLGGQNRQGRSAAAGPGASVLTRTPNAVRCATWAIALAVELTTTDTARSD